MSSFDRNYGLDNRKPEEREPKNGREVRLKEGQEITKQFVMDCEKISLMIKKRVKKKQFEAISSSEKDGCSPVDDPYDDFDFDTGHSQTAAICGPCDTNPKKQRTRQRSHTKSSLGSHFEGHHSKINDRAIRETSSVDLLKGLGGKRKYLSITSPTKRNQAIATDSLTVFRNLENCCSQKCIHSYCNDSDEIESGLNNVVKFMSIYEACSNIIANKSKTEIAQFVYQEFCSSSVIEDSKCVHSFSIVDPTNKKNIPVCRSTWGALYSVAKNYLDQVAAKFKAIKLNQADPVLYVENIQQFTDATVHPYKYNEVIDIIDENVAYDTQAKDGISGQLNLASDMVADSLSPHCDAQSYASIWLEDYFEEYADHSPNSLCKKANSQEKIELFNEYVSDMKVLNANSTAAIEGACEINIVGYSTFNRLWNHLFPHYLTRRFCKIPGKCDTCAKIQALRQNSTDEAVQKAARQLHVLHRGGCFIPERKSYQRRKIRALKYPDHVFSCIIDGMDQSHSVVPYNSNKQFSKALCQHINGVYTHGHGLTIYRSFDNISKGANLTLYCLSAELEKWRNRHGGKFPEEIYIQIDGGSENANAEVLAWCEFIVSKNLARMVILTRLPPGHTHEDIDACFGHIWKHMCKKDVSTPTQYKEFIEKAFSDREKLNAVVEDVFVLPNYVKYFDGHIDAKLARYAKEQHTKLQWTFEAVDISEHFRTGVKVLYRAYSTERTIEFRCLPKNECISPIGQLTGLDPVVVYHKWFPDENTFESRQGIKGFNVLTSLPGITKAQANSGESLFVPVEFVQNSEQAINACLIECLQYFAVGSAEYDAWLYWKDNFSTHQGSSVDYVAKHGMYVPLENFFGKGNGTYNRNTSYWTLDVKRQMYNSDVFKYPQILGASLASVACRFNNHPPQPRHYVSLDKEIAVNTDRFKSLTPAYYASLLENRKYTNASLQKILKSRVGPNGVIPQLTGTKDEMITRINDGDLHLVSIHFRQLVQTDFYFTSKQLNETYQDINGYNSTISSVKLNGHEHNLKVKDFQQLLPSRIIGNDLMNFVMRVYQKNDQKLFDSYETVYSKYIFSTAISITIVIDECMSAWFTVKYKLLSMCVYVCSHAHTFVNVCMHVSMCR